MNPNVVISQSEHELKAHFANDFIANIDGKSCSTLRQFYEEMADLLEIPDFGFNLESLNESMNDLSWLEDERIILYFTNTNELINKERDPIKIGNLLNSLEATAEDWKWTEDDSDDQKEIVMVFEDSPRIRRLLDAENIKYAFLAELK